MSILPSVMEKKTLLSPLYLHSAVNTLATKMCGSVLTLTIYSTPAKFSIIQLHSTTIYLQIASDNPLRAQSQKAAPHF